MRSSSLVTKVLVLTVFISLVSSFVAYRSGVFTEVLYASNLPENDSTKINRDSLLKWQSDSIKALYNMRATSKSGGIFQGTVIPRLPQDTPGYKLDPTFMGSSKSINPIFEGKVIEIDSSK